MSHMRVTVEKIVAVNKRNLKRLSKEQLQQLKDSEKFNESPIDFQLLVEDLLAH